MVLVTKILVFVLIFTILYLLKECLSFYAAFRADREMGLTTKRLIWIGLSISYILTIIFTGFSVW